VIKKQDILQTFGSIRTSPDILRTSPDILRTSSGDPRTFPDIPGHSPPSGPGGIPPERPERIRSNISKNDVDTMKRAHDAEPTHVPDDFANDRDGRLRVIEKAVVAGGRF
jgi:hypothetical protein